MSTRRRVAVLALLAVIGTQVVVVIRAQSVSGPLTEERVVRLVGLKIKGEVIASMIRKQGLDFTADDAVIKRLEKAGAPDVVLDAVRQAGAPKPAAAPEDAVTYQDLLELLRLGVPEQGIIDRLKQSPTVFTPSKEQADELKRLGATDKLLEVMRSVRTPVGIASEISNLAIVFDCSGSMSERTPEGRTKMQAAREAAIELVHDVPEGIRLAFVIYGHTRAQECNAVQVVRPLGPLDRKGKDELVRLIGRLQPVGATPIALALRTAGRELARADAPSGLVLISDGKEMCGGHPTAEAVALTRGVKLDFGVQVVGFGVKPDERQALGEIATAGKGTYYDAPTPAALRDVVQMLAKRIEEEAKPEPEPVAEPGQMTPVLRALAEQLKDEEVGVRRDAAEALGKMGRRARPAALALVDRVADDVWVAGPTVRMYGAGRFADDESSTGSKSAALEALKQVAPERVEEALLRAAKSKDKRVRSWAITKLGGLPRNEANRPVGELPASLKALTDQLRDDDAAIRSAGAQALGNSKLSDADMTPVLRALAEQLKDEEVGVRRDAAEALGKMGRRARPAALALVDRVADDVWVAGPTVRMYGAGRFADDESSTGSKSAALEALKQVAPERVEEALLRAAKSKDKRVKSWAITKLGEVNQEKR